MSLFLCLGLLVFYGSRVVMALRYGHHRPVIYGMVKRFQARLIAAMDGAWIGVLLFEAHWCQPRSGPLTVLGLAAFTSGVLLSLWGRWHLGANWRTAGDAGIVQDHQLITDGPFGWVRNPIYLGTLATFAGHQMIAGHWIFPLLGWILLRRQIAREEPVLAQHFPEYTGYCARVPRGL